jgi:hypothetical protein
MCSAEPQRGAAALAIGATPEMKRKRHAYAEKLRYSKMTPEMKQKKHDAQRLRRQNKADAALSPQSKSKAQELRQAKDEVLSPQSKRKLYVAEQAWLRREKTPHEVEQDLHRMAPSASGIAMRAQVIADAALKAQQWQERARCVTERESRKMSTAVQNELDKEGMFDLCLASLKRGANGGLWSSVLLCAELLEKGKLFFIDIEGRRKSGVWEVSIVTKGSLWTRLMNPLSGAPTLEVSREQCRSRFCHEKIFGTAYEAFVGVPLPPGQDHTCALAHFELVELVEKLEQLNPECSSIAML